jgi:hypothetical protein
MGLPRLELVAERLPKMKADFVIFTYLNQVEVIPLVKMSKTVVNLHHNVMEKQRKEPVVVG